MRWAEVPHRTFSEVLHSLIYNYLYIVRMPSARPKESFGPPKAIKATAVPTPSTTEMV